jgi:hypothetical protein
MRNVAWLEEAHKRTTLALGVAVRGVIGVHTTVMHKQHKPQRGQRDCANEKRIHHDDSSMQLDTPQSKI